MSSKQRLVAMTAIACFLVLATAQSFAQETPKVEFGVHATTLNLGDFRLAVPDLSRSARGVGARVTVNLNDNTSIEGEYNIFPNDFRLTIPQLSQLTRRLTRDRVNQFLVGVKYGVRSNRFGLFAKLRPGFVSSEIRDETINPNPTLNTLFRTSTGLALDAGGVFEFYLSRNLMFRLDAGDTIIRYETKTQNTTTNTAKTSKFTSHNLQLSAGFALRF